MTGDWTGSRDARGRPHGRGTLRLSKRARFEGRMVRGKRSGLGTLFVDEAHSLVNSAAANRSLTDFCDPGGFRCIGAGAAGGGTSSSGEGGYINTLIIAAGPKAQMEKWLSLANPNGDQGLGDRPTCGCHVGLLAVELRSISLSHAGYAATSRGTQRPTPRL